MSAVAPVIREYSDRAEHERGMPPEVFEALRAHGFTRLWVSRALGGEQIDLCTGMAILQELARLDASVAWQIGVQGAIGRVSDYLDDQVAKRIFTEHTGLVIGGFKPYGTAEPVDGDYLLTGEWSMASGFVHADWPATMAFVTRDGAPIATPYGPDVRVLIVPRGDAEMLDTWHSLGLRGTGSHHYRIGQLFVPDELTIGRAAMQRAPEGAERGYPLSYYDFGPFAAEFLPMRCASADKQIADGIPAKDPSL